MPEQSKQSKNSLLEYTVSISALITAVVAVVIAVVELRTNREYQRLSVEPYFEIANSNLDGYQYKLFNSGLGPGRIDRVLVTIDGKNIDNWNSAVSILTDNKKFKIIKNDLWHGRQLKAAEEISLIKLPEKEIGRIFHQNIAKLNFSICYCSIYKDCWIKETNKAPLPVAMCPVDWPKGF